MRKVVIALAAVGTLIAGTAAMAQVDVRIGESRRDWDRGRDWEHRRHDDGVRFRVREGVRGEYYGGGCRSVTIRERRGDTVVVKRIRRCD